MANLRPADSFQQPLPSKPPELVLWICPPPPPPPPPFSLLIDCSCPNRKPSHIGMPQILEEGDLLCKPQLLFLTLLRDDLDGHWR